MTAMPDKKINTIGYNHLNLPNDFSLPRLQSLSYKYRAGGVKIAKKSTVMETSVITDYLDGFQYSGTKSNSLIISREALDSDFAFEREAFEVDEVIELRTAPPALEIFPTAEGFYDYQNKRYIYQYRDHLGNVRVSYAKGSNGPEVLDTNDYYPFGMNFLNSDLVSYLAQPWSKYKYNGKELQETGMYDYGARMYMSDIGRWGVVDPLAEQFPGWSPYNYTMNNPINLTDPTGMAPEDWVQRGDGSIYWDKNANSQATTKAGETYLGKTLTFEFNSYIDGANWDGPNPLIGPSPVGDKLTSTINVTGVENEAGELTGINATKQITIGKTPWGKARDSYPGLGDGQNKFSFSKSMNADGTLGSYNLNFEQHASVSKIEEIGMQGMGYNIVNVAQKLNLNYSGGNLSVSSYTDVFPSATLKMNGTQMMYYKQPSFKATHSLPIRGYTPPSMREGTTGGRPIYDYSYKPAMWYRR